MEKLRWGVIGAGGIADTRTIPGILEARNAELVALTARTPERAEQLRRKHGAKRAYTSEEELLRDPEVILRHRSQSITGKERLRRRPESTF